MPIVLYLKHHWVGRKDALGFGPNRVRTLVSMATDSSHSVIMGESCGHSSALIFNRIFFNLADRKDNHKVSNEFEIQPDLISDY